MSSTTTLSNFFIPFAYNLLTRSNKPKEDISSKSCFGAIRIPGWSVSLVNAANLTRALVMASLTDCFKPSNAFLVAPPTKSGFLLASNNAVLNLDTLPTVDISSKFLIKLAILLSDILNWGNDSINLSCSFMPFVLIKLAFFNTLSTSPYNLSISSSNTRLLVLIISASVSGISLPVLKFLIISSTSFVIWVLNFFCADSNAADPSW